MTEDQEVICSCPYCGSRKISRVDWGFADWECDVCRNNFRSPRRHVKNYGISDTSDTTKRSNNYLKRIYEYAAISLIVLSIIFIMVFLLTRLIQGIMRMYQ